MNPVLWFEAGPLQGGTSAYRFFFVLAAGVTVALAALICARRGLPVRRSLACLLACAAAVPVGSRLLDVLTKPGPTGIEVERILAPELTGFSMLGGLLLAAPVGAVACRALSIGAWHLADSLAPALGAGIALMRIGCFQAGCCFGDPSDLPWAVTFPPGSEAHLAQLLASGGLVLPASPLPVHPTQLYEAGGAATGAVLAGSLLARRAPSGAAFLALAAAYGAVRLLNHPLRGPSPSLALPDWFYPAVYAAIVVASVWRIAIIWRAGRVAPVGPRPATKTTERREAHVPATTL